MQTTEEKLEILKSIKNKDEAVAYFQEHFAKPLLPKALEKHKQEKLRQEAKNWVYQAQDSGSSNKNSILGILGSK